MVLFRFLILCCVALSVAQNQGNLRLFRGTSTSGIVQVFDSGTWKTLCGTNFGKTEALVVCLTLNYYNGTNLPSSAFGQLDNVTSYSKVFSTTGCVTGTELNIFACELDDNVVCADEDVNYASVTCFDTAEPVSEYTVRLDDEGAADSGYFSTVLVYKNDMWGHICGQFWDDNDANVVCKDLGFLGGVASYTSSDWSVPTLLMETGCNGSEDSLSACNNQDVVCYGDHVADVVCYKSESPSLQLVGGKDHFGFVVFSVDGLQGLFCDPASKWSFGEAYAVCKTMGYTSGFVITGTDKDSLTSPSTDSVFIEDISCTGSEESIYECDNSGWTNLTAQCADIKNVAAVYCYTTGRLVTLYLEQEDIHMGRVELMDNGTWRAVCADTFTQTEANVLCTQLGFPEAEILLPGNFGNGYFLTTPINSLSCTGTEASLAYCSYVVGRCETYRQHAALVCRQINVDNGYNTSIFENYHGDVVIERYGVKGRVCRAGWDDKEADVLCKSKGFTAGFMYGTPVAYSRIYPIWATNFTCNGGEDSLLNCEFQSNLGLDWSCAQDYSEAGVLCYTNNPPEIKVGNNGSSASDTFRAEVYHDQTGWGTICDDGTWSAMDALVYCRELGYPDGQVARNGFRRGSVGQFVVMSGLQCTGTETSILQCPNYGWKQVSSLCEGHASDAAVYCYRWVTTEPGKQFGAVLYHSGDNYGLVCADGFDDNAALAVCREQSPFPFSIGKALCCSAAGPDNREFTLSDVKCTGQEHSLRECTYNDQTPQCSSGQYAAIACADIFLGYRKLEADPVVEVTYLTQTGYVCSEGFTDHDATVVCRQLGYSFAEKFKASAMDYTFNVRWLRGFGCQGNESMVTDCQDLSWGNIGVCSWNSVAAVRCTNNQTDLQFDIRIVNGTTTGGRVELKIDNEWGTVCGNDLTKNEASVICQQLGYHDGVAMEPGFYGAGQGKIHVSGFQCEGNETSITDCIWVGYKDVGILCDHSKDAAVNCFDNIQLAGSTTVNYGRFEVFDASEGGWVAVCDNSINTNEATIICRQLGYNDGLIHRGSPLGPTDLKIAITGVNCEAVTKCTYTSGECLTGRYAAMYCSENTIVNENINIRLPLNSFYGPVSIQRYGLWGHVCSVEFDDDDALVICKQLGYQSGQALNTFKTEGFPVIQGGVECEGAETNIADCTRSPFVADHGCYGVNTVAAVLCYNEPGLTLTSTPLDVETGKMTTIAGLEMTSKTLRFEFSGFTDVDAAVYCNALDYAGGQVYRSTQGGFGVSQIDCEGSEETILQCAGTWDPSKTQNQEGDLAGVICYTAVRLVGGDPSFYGVVYTSKGVSSGPVCSTGFDTVDAGVACKSLNYNAGLVLCCSPFGVIQDPAILTNVQCTGSEKQFTDCPHDEIAETAAESCQKNYAAVMCYSTPKSTDYTLYLSGNTEYTGHVIVSYMNVNGTICMDGWNDNSASVACKELGYTRGVAYNAVRSSISPGPYWTSNVQCAGNEARLSDCQLTELGTVEQCSSSTSQAGVICFDNEGIFYRLGGTGEARYGRVELSINGEWRSVCNLFWENKDSQVLCKMLGYSTGEVYTGAVNGSLSGPVWEVNYQCDGSESNLNLCVSSGWRVSTQATCAQHENDAGTFCYKSVKLSTGVGRETDQGGVLLYKDNEWYTACCDGFNDTSAAIVCRELGFRDGQALACSSFGDLNEYPLLNTHKISCHGDETDVSDCLVNHMCQGDNYASVVCYTFLNTTEPQIPVEKESFDARPIIIAVVLFVVLLVIAVIVAVVVVKYRRRKKIEKSKQSFDGTIVSENLDGSIVVTNRLSGLLRTPEVPRVQYSRNTQDGGEEVNTLGASNGYASLKLPTEYDNHGYSSLKDKRESAVNQEPDYSNAPLNKESNQKSSAINKTVSGSDIRDEPELQGSPGPGRNKTVIKVQADLSTLKFENDGYMHMGDVGKKADSKNQGVPNTADRNRLSLSQQDEVDLSRGSTDEN